VEHAAEPVERAAELHPAVLALGGGRRRSQQRDAIGLRLHRPEHVGHLGHEGRLAQDEVIGGEERDRRVGVAAADPVGRVQDRRGGAAIARLHENVGRLVDAGELAGDMVGVLAHRHHHRAGERKAEGEPIERLAQQAARLEQRDVLLGPLVTERAPDQWAQAAPLPAGQHHRPRVSGRATR
jgi:hypothetical protein